MLQHQNALYKTCSVLRLFLNCEPCSNLVLTKLLRTVCGSSWSEVDLIPWLSGQMDTISMSLCQIEC